MSKINHEQTQAERRKRRVRGKISGTQERPRLSVSRSNKHMFVQAVNDEKGETIAAASEHDIKEKGTKTQRAVAVAGVMAERLKKAGVKAVVFDRGSNRYFGRVKAVADTLRKAGVQL